MAGPSSANRRLQARSLARVQACVDQLQGQDTFVVAMEMIGVKVDPGAMRARALQLLQEELDVVFRVSGLHSPSQEADAADWLLGKMRP